MRDNRPGKGKGSRDGGVAETMKYRMPTYDWGPNRAAVASQKHPRLSTGKGCVRIRDSQQVPLDDLVVSFRLAMNFKKPLSAGRGRGVKK